MNPTNLKLQTLNKCFWFTLAAACTILPTQFSSGSIASFVYKLGTGGNRTNLTENINGSARTNIWAYDVLYRLTNEITRGTTPVGTNDYRYDLVGNRTNRTTTFTGVTGLTNQNFTFTTNDWLASDVYDANGNTRTNGANTFAYDAENRLTNYNAAAATFVYNGDGWLVRKTVGSTTTLYLVDDRNPTGYSQAIEEATVTGGVTNLSVIYLPGLNLVSQNRSGTVSYYGNDGNGNTRYLTGSGATVTDTYAYDAYGVPLASTGSTVNEFRYAGERLIPETGLTYLRARYLNTGTGRFWTRDSFRGYVREPLTLHRYSYVIDDPINRIDPSGLDTGSAVGALGGISLGGILQGLPTLVISKSFVTAVAVSVAIGATLGGDSKSDNSAMRLQLQAGDAHYWSQVLGAPQSIGVTSVQVRAGLAAMHTAVLTDFTFLPFPDAAEPGLFSAIIRMSQKLTPITAGGGVTQGGSVLREIFYYGHDAFRVDLENLRGHNLRR